MDAYINTHRRDYKSLPWNSQSPRWLRQLSDAKHIKEIFNNLHTNAVGNNSFESAISFRLSDEQIVPNILVSDCDSFCVIFRSNNGYRHLWVCRANSLFMLYFYASKVGCCWCWAIIQTPQTDIYLSLSLVNFVYIWPMVMRTYHGFALALFSQRCKKNRFLRTNICIKMNDYCALTNEQSEWQNE